MTDARMPERYLMDRRLHRLSAEDFRAFVFALLYSVANRTDGILTDEDLALIPNFPAGMCATRIVASGMWELHLEGYYITDFDKTQTSRDELEVLDNARRRDRDKKRRRRQAQVDATELVPGDVSGDVSPVQHRQGQDKARQGQDRTGEDSKPNHLQSVPEPANDLQRAAMASWKTEAAAS